MKRSGKTDQQQRGIVIAVVVVVLIVLSGLTIEFTRRAVGDRRQMRRELEYSQTLELAKAGVLRLQSHGKANSPAETLKVPFGTINETKSGTVVISVKETEAEVTARYPDNQSHPGQVTRKITF